MSPSDGPERVSPAEIAALLARLRALSEAGSRADEAERDRLLADKELLMARVEADLAAGRTLPAAPASTRADGDGPQEWIETKSDDRLEARYPDGLEAEFGDGADDGDSAWGAP